MKKVVFYIMTEKGLEVLKKAIEVNLKIIDFIVVGKDGNVKEDFSKEIIELARNANVDFYLRGQEPIVDNEKYVVAISWRWMIHHPIDKLVIFHDSILPKYRGFAPLVNMLINGESQIGASAVFGATDYDKGDLIAQRISNIEYPITISEAIALNNRNFIELVEQILLTLSNNKELLGVQQHENETSYSIWRDDDDYWIDWSKSSDEIKRFIDAVGYPYLGARTSTAKGEKIRVLKAEVVEDVHCELRHVGKVIFVNDGLPTVICGNGLLRINEAYYVDGDGKSYLPMKSFRIKFV